MPKTQHVCLDEVIGYFNELDEPRDTVNRKHPLVSVVVIALMAEQREGLRAIFEDRSIRSAAQGVKRLQAWITRARELGLKGLNAFCQTLSNWLGKIANYFVNRSSNGRTEGFNRAPPSILWRAFGMTNFDTFRLRALARFGRPAQS